MLGYNVSAHFNITDAIKLQFQDENRQAGKVPNFMRLLNLLTLLLFSNSICSNEDN